MSANIVEHYEPGNLAQVIELGLNSITGGSRQPTIDDLAPVDEFHIGGRQASIHLFDRLSITTDDRVLDIGAGIGGTARFVADRYGSKVEGIDLTPEFCRVAESLTNQLGLSDQVNVRQGSALAMPYDDDSFSIAYMMHVGMNIEDKASLFSEVKRVLQPGGVFAIYDVLAGNSDREFRFPVPWASTSASSFLSKPEAVQSVLELQGFSIEEKTDRTEFAIEFFTAVLAASSGGPPPIGLHLILGANAKQKLTNMVGNIQDGLCGPWEIIARARP